MSLLMMGVQADTRQIGAVYPIFETDALEAIEARAKAADWHTLLDKPVEQWGALNRRVRLPVATAHRVRHHRPLHTTEWAIHDGQGKTLYPKGFTYNPLAYLNLWTRLVITDARHLSWLQDRLLPTDTLLLTDGDPLALSRQLERPVYLLDASLAKPLDLKVQPALVVQEGEALVIEELVPPAAESVK